MSNTTLAVSRKARSTTVALKVAMAISGILFVLYLLAHMYGNLKMFAGPEAFNGYAHHLRIMGEPYLPYSGALWILRIVLLVAVIVHVYAAAELWKRSKRARGSRYVKVNRLEQSYSSRLMRWGGVILLLFIIFHLLHFTTLTIQVGGDYGAMQPYDRVIASFSNPLLYAAYFIAMLALVFHIRHGVWSGLATLGANRESNTAVINVVAIIVAAVIFIGFLLPPTAILLGLIS